MASAKTATRNGVDFDLLDDIEGGDVLKLHFTEDAIGDVAYLVGMINAGILTSPDEVVLLAIAATGYWGDSANRYVEFSPTENFDRAWFESRTAKRIDKLEVKSRRRPLVDLSVLDQPGASVRYRFKAEGVKGVGDMLDLHDLGLLELGSAAGLRYISEVGEWVFPKSRAGHFTNMLAGDDNQSYRDHFITNIAPHLELLRP